jgi:hypothetical protein
VGKGYVPLVYCALFVWLGGFSCVLGFCLYFGYDVLWVVMLYWGWLSLCFDCLYIVWVRVGSCECT